jgi:hypothetical protein
MRPEALNTNYPPLDPPEKCAVCGQPATQHYPPDEYSDGYTRDSAVCNNWECGFTVQCWMDEAAEHDGSG